MYKKNFIGHEGFVWWLGIIENRMDPLRVGRCQVRIFGWHTDDKTLIPTEDLPWALPMFAINESMTTNTPKDGDMVVGFFTDGQSGQQPVMMGVIPGVPSADIPATQGFSDARKEADLQNAPAYPTKEYSTDGTGIVITRNPSQHYPDPTGNSAINLGEATTARSARYENILKMRTIQDQRENLVEDVATADGSTWSEPFPPYNPKYPYNSVKETEFGHLFEMDDTPGWERLHLAHGSGTFQHVFPTGTKVEKIVRDNYEITLGTNYVNIMGNCNLTVDGGVNIISRGDANITVYNDVNLKVAGDINASVGGDYNIKAGGNFNVDAAEVQLNSGYADGLPDAPARVTANAGQPAAEPTPAEQAGVMFDAGEAGAAAHIQRQISNGVYKDADINRAAVEGTKDNAQGKAIPPKTTDCGDIHMLTSFPDTLQLSKHFTLGQLSNRSVLPQVRVHPQRGLKVDDIVCNLKMLALNALDPIKDQYPNMVVTNAFRNPEGASAGRSQHEIGQAADMQFTGATKAQYFAIAQWIRDNISYDQLLLEYKTTGTKGPWIHISFNVNGNRAPTDRTKVMTFYNHSPKTSGLIDLSGTA